MSYIFSRALVAASSLASCLDTQPSAPSNGSPMPKPCLWRDKTMEPSLLSRFGMTCKPLTENHGAELLTSWLAGFPAKTSALQEKAKGLTENDRECGQKWRGSLAKYDPATRTLKTAQLSFLEDLTGCLLTLPRSGWMRDGECFQLPALVPPICESAPGFWQMPVADDAVNRVAGKWNSRGEPKLSAQVMYPTPLANSHTGAGHGPNKTGAPNLQTFVAMCPTPTVCGNYNRKGLSPTSGDGLATVVSQHEAFQPGQQTPPTRLNPDWVEWLMGWPIGHTELKPLATAKYQEWLQQHSSYSGPCNAVAAIKEIA